MSAIHMMRRKSTCVITAAAAVLGAVGWAMGDVTQPFPAKKEAFGVSVYLVAPTEGLQEATPGKWRKITAYTWGNVSLANVCLTPEKGAGSFVTTSYAVPRADYRVSLLVRGNGKARLEGTEDWKVIAEPDAKRGNAYKWFELGTVKAVDKVAVEVVPGGSGPALFYGGMLLEGTVMPVVPVTNVLAKLKKGGPVTIVLLGDSVTENWGGTGGGASAFEKGNAGLMLAFLRQFGEVSYLTHRSPPGWPKDFNKDADKVPRVVVDGQEYLDSRIEMDTSKPIRLVNLGKGGAASDWGWSRMGDTLFDQDPWSRTLRSIRFGLGHYAPDLVIINLGTNDVNGEKGKRWSMEEYLFHMKIMASEIQRRFGAAVILSTPHKWTGGTHLLNHFQPQMVDALRAYCRETGLRLADVYNEYGAGEYDGIHPKNPGHQHIADAYIKAIQGEPSVSKIKARITAAALKDNGDGTVTDTTTGLVWIKDADLGKGAKTWAEAAALLADLNQQKKFGRQGWRLPTLDELQGLVDPGERPAIPKGSPFVNVGGWTITALSPWGVDMRTGVSYAPNGNLVKTPAGFVWAVCGGHL